jgi:MinD superfamily P-loop ATPase
MIIAIASGKGGTGKTTTAVALALSIPGTVTLLDCDVEEPNAGLFLPQSGAIESTITVPVPVIQTDRCTGCGECARFCEFNALVCIGKTAMAFNDLCHSCGGCMRVCQAGAITEIPFTIGTKTVSTVSRQITSAPDIPVDTTPPVPPLQLIQGRLTIGKALSPPVIRGVKSGIHKKDAHRISEGAAETTIIDCPPGTSCPMVTAVTGSDYVILVTEPTPFGLHDLDLAVKTVRLMRIPFGVIINRADSENTCIDSYCKKEQIGILMHIPEDRRIACAYSEGIPLVLAVPDYAKKFRAIPAEICRSITQ